MLKKTASLNLLLVLVLLATALGFFTAAPAQAGTPDDTYKPERYYTANASEQTTTQTTYQDTLTLTFTPPSDRAFLIIASALTNNSSTSYATKVKLLVDATSYSETSHRPANTSLNWRSFATQKIISGTGGVAMTVKIQYATENASGTAYIKNAAIAVLEVTNYYSAADETETTNSTTSYVDKVTLTFTPSTAADYIIFSTANTYNDIANKSCYLDYTVNGTPDLELETVNSPYASYGHAEKRTLTATSQTFKLRFKTETGGNAYIKGASIIAVLASDLGANQYIEEDAEESTQSASYVTKVSLGFTPTTRNDYIILAAGLGRQESPTYGFYANLDIDGVSHGEYVFAANDRALYRSFFILTKTNLVTTAQADITIQYKTNNSSPSTEAFSKNNHILAIKANTVESYDDSGHTTIDNDFGSGQTTAYTWSHGLDTSINYDVAYYDAGASGGQRQGIDSNKAPTSYGNLSSSFLLTTNPLATPGTWHAVVFRTGASVPTNYNDAAGTTGYVSSDSFAVQASAIPEFPAVIAAIGVSGLCFAIYYLMRKRRLSYA